MYLFYTFERLETYINVVKIINYLGVSHNLFYTNI